MPIPEWLNIIAWISLIGYGLCSVIVLVDVIRRPQHMAVMNVVWPLTPLYSGLLGLWAYYKLGRPMSRAMMAKMKAEGKEHHRPFWQSVVVGATHCGSGCTLGDILAEALAATFPVVLLWAGYQTIWPQKPFAVWTIDFVFALVIGIVFQYFSIVPMRKLPPVRGLVEAMKADVLSLTAWQVGMYGWMSVALFAIFGPDHLDARKPTFWLMMQIAMICGFVTSYPVNWWLIRRGIKEKM